MKPERKQVVKMSKCESTEVADQEGDEDRCVICGREWVPNTGILGDDSTHDNCQWSTIVYV